MCVHQRSSQNILCVLVAAVPSNTLKWTSDISWSVCFHRISSMNTELIDHNNKKVKLCDGSTECLESICCACATRKYGSLGFRHTQTKKTGVSCRVSITKLENRWNNNKIISEEKFRFQYWWRWCRWHGRKTKFHAKSNRQKSNETPSRKCCALVFSASPRSEKKNYRILYLFAIVFFLSRILDLFFIFLFSFRFITRPILHTP